MVSVSCYWSSWLLLMSLFSLICFFRTASDHMTAAVIATPPVVQSVNRILCYPEPLTSGPPHAKRSRFPSGPAVLLLTDLAPLLTFHPNKCSVLLHFSTTEAGSASRHCQLISIDLKGAVEGRFHPYLLEDCDADSGVSPAGTMFLHPQSCTLNDVI